MKTLMNIQKIIEKIGKTDKKTTALVIGVTIMALGLPMFAAFEAHVINVRVKVTNVLKVGAIGATPGELDMGKVASGDTEIGPGKIRVGLSKSFLDEPRVKDIDYILRCKSKNHEQGTAPTPDHSGEYWDKHNLCDQDFSILRIEDDEGNSYEPKKNANPDMPQSLDKSVPDLEDIWKIYIPEVPYFYGVGASNNETLHSPCDKNHGIGTPDIDENCTTDNEDYGADLWIETTGFSYN